MDDKFFLPYNQMEYYGVPVEPYPPRRLSPNNSFFITFMTLILPFLLHYNWVSFVSSQMVQVVHSRKGEGSIPADPYRYPHDGSLSPETTAIVVIDMQRDCTFFQFGLVFQCSFHLMPRSL